MDINQYFSNMKYFKNKIIVISAKDEPSRKLTLLEFKENLRLKMEIGYRNSYVAVIDNKRGFVYEKADKNIIDCSYQIKNNYIDIVSAGFDNGNKSSIKIGETEYSKNKRSLNIAIFHYKSLLLVDSFYVDTYEDKSLTIRR